MDKSLFFILKAYLKKERFNINLEELEFQLVSHPFYPSLQSLTEVLSHFGIDNLTLELPTDLETLNQMPERFISLTKNDQFMIVSKVGNKFEVILDNKDVKNYGALDFLKCWGGIVVATEIVRNPNEEEKQIDPKRFSKAIYIITAIAVLLSFFFLTPTLFQFIHYSLSTLGVLTSILIINHELGFSSETVDKFCSGAKSTSCNDVLNSKGASVLGFLKLSDLSMIYFLGLLLASLLSKMLEIHWGFIMMVSMLALPATVYSIYYQYKVVKKWCPLCLGIVVIQWLQFGDIMINNAPSDFFYLNVTNGAIALLSFLVVTAIWLFIKPLLNKEQALQQLKIEHYKFKRNFDLFLSILDKGTLVEPNLPTLGAKEIILGNVNAGVNILLVTSPRCFYCKSVHRDLEKILDENYDKINLKLRFNVNAKDKEDIGSRVCSRLLELYVTESKEVIVKAIGEAYAKNSDLPKWLMDWGEPVNYEAYSSILLEQQEWCIEKKVHFTPAVFINGKEFPEEYQRTDLSYFIEDLNERAHDISIIEEAAELVNS